MYEYLSNEYVQDIFEITSKLFYWLQEPINVGHLSSAFLIPLIITTSSCALAKTIDNASSIHSVNSQISASLSDKKRLISPRLMCFTINSVRAKSWEYPDSLNAAQLLSPKVLRLPGDMCANYWDWRLGTKNNREIFPNPEDYVKTAFHLVEKIKEVFPLAKASVMGVLVNPDLKIQPFDKIRRTTWNRRALLPALENADAITLHFHPGHGLESNPNDPIQNYPLFDESDVSTILGEPFRFWQNLQKKGQLDSLPLHKKIWVTEYNLHERLRKNSNKQPRVTGSWTHGLHTLALSLLLLEKTQIEKNCNHMLIGNSQFAAIYADKNSFLNPSDPSIATQKYGMSATGSSLKYLGLALRGCLKRSEKKLLNH